MRISEEEEIRIGVFVCEWGFQIAAYVDVPTLTEYAATLPNVVTSVNYLSLCTTAGADLIKDKIVVYNLNRIVVAACTPKTHEPVFRGVLKELGMSPSYLEFVNIREHVASVHMEEPEDALQKAKDLVRAGVARAAKLEDVPRKVVSVNPTALVIGGGIGGLSAALNLGNEGFKVYLVEKAPSIGGHMAGLDRTYPTDDCSIWILGPVMLEVDRHPNVEVMSYSEVKSVSGVIGGFTVMVEHMPRYIDEVKCNGCGNCSSVCPVYAPNEFDCNIGPRKAIYKPFAQAVPNIVTIDMDYCIKCRLCVPACELDAIRFDQRPKLTELNVGTIIVATGFDEYKPYGVYGYGEFENVITQNEFERLLAPNGPTLGHLRRISDDKAPKHIAVLQCVGSRDRTKNLHCSGYCCMVGIKNAKLAKLHDRNVEVTVCYMDIRAAGKDFEEYYTRSRKHKIKYLRGNVSEIAEDPETKNLILTVEDTLSNQIKTIEADLVILSTAMVPGEGTVDIANLLKLERSPDGFIKEFHSRLSPVDTKVPGIYLAGACQGPKSVAETVASAKGAAAAASGPLITLKYEMELIKAIVDDERCASCTLCVLSCPYDAITMDETGIAKVNEVRCRGCGTCSSVCLSNAITLRYYRDEQLEAFIDALLAPEETVTEKIAAEEEAGG